MALGPWPNNVSHIQDGEAVAAGIASRPDRTLEQRTAYLKARLDAAALGEAVFDVGATIDPAILEGQPVFWNPTTIRYELALATTETDPASGTLLTAPSADVDGIVYLKTAANEATICLIGIVQLAAITNAIGTTVTPGRYYLSGAQAGKLTLERPPVTIPVCKVLGAVSNCADAPWVLINPQQRDFLAEHIHYRFELVSLPAGDVDGVTAFHTGHHAITNADATLPGWLPANDPSFHGLAPHGAAFGYNLAAQSALARIWPPVPLQAVSVLFDRGDGHGGSELHQGLNGIVYCDVHGIWWMTDCYGDVPWPTTYTNFGVGAHHSSLSSSSSMQAFDCPRQELMHVSVVFLRMLFSNSLSTVTSLTPAKGSPLVITGCNGQPASRGDLTIDLNLPLLLDTAETAGSLVLKGIAGTKFLTGHVLEGLLAGSNKVTLSSATTRHVNPADPTSATLYQGVVTLDVNANPLDRELAAQVMKIGDARERTYKGLLYMGLPAGRTSGVLCRFDIPPDGLPNSPLVNIRALLLGVATGGTLPPVTLSYLRVPMPAVGTPVALPSGSTTVAFPSTVSVSTDQLAQVLSANIPVAAGDTLFVTLTRGSSDSYAGELGLVRLGCLMEA